MKRLPVAAFVAGFVLSQGTAHSDETEIVLKNGPGRDLVSTRCVLCHSLDYIPMNAPVMTQARWKASVRKMIDTMGAPINDAEAEEIVQYLTLHYAEQPK
jgi:hypothetical protein